MIQASQIGFSQRLQLSWLDYTANLVLAGNSREETAQCLREHLAGKLSVGSSAERGNREKAITLLLRIWLIGPPAWPKLRDQGLELVRTLPVAQHLPVHWGMTMAVYPFFAAVAEATGRLLRLQEAVSSAQIQRRLRENYGERETVSRAAQRILRLFVDWGVLNDTATKGVYSLATPHNVPNEKQVLWLLLTLLAANNGIPESLRSLLQHPALFPFTLSAPTLTALEKQDQLTVQRQGFDQEVLLGLSNSNVGQNS